MPYLPPSGPHRIGSIRHTLLDAGRPSHVLSHTAGRRLVLKCWYPAAAGSTEAAERIWAELRDDRAVPFPVRALLKCLRQVTSTQPGAPFDGAARVSRLVLYNHGLVSFAAENTSLAEELASHGFTVVAIQHAEQMLELKALNAAQSEAKKRADAALTVALRKAEGEARAKLAVEYYAASTNTNRIVVERAVDTSYVLDRVGEIGAQIPGSGAAAIDANAALLVGFSVGGAVATETAKRDARAAAVVSLDGGMQGTPGAGEIRQPYFMMYSAANAGMNDALLPRGVQRVAPARTAHLNYHDVAGLVPGLRLMGAVGAIDARAFLIDRNRAVLDFCVARA